MSTRPGLEFKQSTEQCEKLSFNKETPKSLIFHIDRLLYCIRKIVKGKVYIIKDIKKYICKKNGKTITKYLDYGKGKTIHAHNLNITYSIYIQYIFSALANKHATLKYKVTITYSFTYILY